MTITVGEFVKRASKSVADGGLGLTKTEAAKLELALKRANGSRFLGFLKDNSIDLSTYFASGVTKDIVLDEALSGLSIEFLDAELTAAGHQMPVELIEKLKEYQTQERELFGQIASATSGVAEDKAIKHVLDDALSKFSGTMPRESGAEGLNKWVESYEKRVEYLKSAEAGDAAIELAEKQVAEARKVAGQLAEQISHVKDASGKYKKAQGYESVLNTLHERSEGLQKSMDRVAENLDSRLKDAARETRDAYRAVKDECSKFSKGSRVKALLAADTEHLEIDNIVREVQEQAAKLGSTEGKFTGTFTKTVNAVGETASKAAEEAKGFFRHNTQKGFFDKTVVEGAERINMRRGRTAIAGATAALGASWLLGAFKSKHPEANFNGPPSAARSA